MRGLWLRGSIYHVGVRVPVDSREALGCSHVQRSRQTDGPSLAIRLNRTVAFEDTGVASKTRVLNVLHRLIDGTLARTAAIARLARDEDAARRCLIRLQAQLDHCGHKRRSGRHHCKRVAAFRRIE